jgi:hypothetical protein
MSKQDISFDKFLTLFPEIELPITLTTDAHIEFSRHNKPIPLPMIDEFLASAEDDELTEYIACFKIPQTRGFHALVYWKAALMEYQYQMATFDKEGYLINKRFISGTKTNGKNLLRSVATIEADWLINVVEGAEKIEHGQNIFNPQSSRVHSLELTASGEIIVAEE